MIVIDVPGTPEPGANVPPEWTVWQYPDSKEQGASKGGGGQVNGVSTGPVFSVETTTHDEFDTVLTWYSKKFDNQIIANTTRSGSLGRFDSENKDDPIVNGSVIVSSRPSDDRNAGSPRPVKMKVISFRTPRYALVVNVSRAEDEPHTHVFITYFPNSPGQ